MQIRSPAKVNLVLNLLRKREDGFHEVDFVMQELEIHDTITLETIPHSTSIQITCDDPSVPTDERNLVHKAASLMQEECKKKSLPIQGVKITIEKRIPSAGGLGGGSSNAAAVLKGLDALWGIKLSKNLLNDLAARIGSDVPFFLHGGTCRAQGRGEIITPLEKCPSLNLAFIVPPVKVPSDKTRWIYGNFDVKEVESHPSVENFRSAMRTHDVHSIARVMGNVFENNVKVKEYEPVWFLIDSLKRLPGVYNVILAGAGPTICIVCDSPRVAETIISPFKAKNYGAFVTRTV
jgi:4-diphosphocytidyl-2-C-methyl-D-erythritol kinase